MILIGTTLTTFAMDDAEVWGSWLQNAQAFASKHEVSYLAAIEVDARGLAPFGPLLDALGAVGGKALTFRIDDRDTITSANRLTHICTGRNLLTEAAVVGGHEWLWFMDADTSHPADALDRLLELEHPLVGCHVPTYCLGERDPLMIQRNEGTKWSHWVPASADEVAGIAYAKSVGNGGIPPDVRAHMNTAGSCLVRRDLFRFLRWRHDPEAGMTDDPCYHLDAQTRGVEWLVRHDCLATHHPESIRPLELRKHDLSVVR